MSVTKEAVIERLRTVRGPDFDGDLVSLGMVSDIFIADAKVFFSITVPAARAQELEPLRAAAERAVKGIPGRCRGSRGADRRKEGRRHGSADRRARRAAGDRRAAHGGTAAGGDAPASHSQASAAFPA